MSPHPHFLVVICRRRATHESRIPSGKVPTTRVRRRITFIMCSRLLFALRRVQMLTREAHVRRRLHNTLFPSNSATLSSFILRSFSTTSAVFFRAASLVFLHHAFSIAVTSPDLHFRYFTNALRYQWTTHRCHFALEKESPSTLANPEDLSDTTSFTTKPRHQQFLFTGFYQKLPPVRSSSHIKTVQASFIPRCVTDRI